MTCNKSAVLAYTLVGTVLHALADVTGPLPSTFDASTGYVTMTVGDSAHGSRTQYAFCHSDNDSSIGPAGKGSTGRWSDGEAPHSTTNYYVGNGKTLCTENAGGANTFAGKRLVIDNGGLLQSMANDSNSACINDLWMIGGSKFTWSAAKNPLTGTCSVTNSSSSFVYFNLGYTGTEIQSFKMKLIGDTDQRVFVTGSTGTELSPVDGLLHYGHLNLNCDLSAYKGILYLNNRALVRIGTSLPGSAMMYTDKTNGYFGSMPNKGALSVASVTADRGLRLIAAQGSTLTVNSLSLSADATIGIAWGASTETPGKLVIAGRSGTWPSKIAVAADGKPYGFSGEIIRIKAVALPAGGLTAANFTFPSALGVTYSVATESGTGDCVISVVSPEWVTHSTTGVTKAGHITPNDFTSTKNYLEKFFWSNESCPALDANAAEKIWYFPASIGMYPADIASYPTAVNGIYAIPSKYVYFDTGSHIEHFASVSGLRANFVWNGFKDNGNAQGAVKVRTPDVVANRSTFGYYGTVQLLDGSSNELLMYGSGLEVIAAELSGGGDLTLKTYPTAGNPNTNDGYHEFYGTNTSWTGKLKVTQTYEMSKYAALGVTTPNMTNCCRVIINDARNLGGARAAYTYDALHLEHYARFITRTDVTLADDLNRGVFIGDIGRFWQPANTKLTINQPVTLHGQLYKEGAGTLVLGGSSLKFGGSSQSDTPTANSNLVTIAAGALKVSNAAALDGAAITLKSGAKLLVDPSATAATALRVAKSGSSLAAEGTQNGAIPVVIDFPANPTRCGYGCVLCTASSADLTFSVTPVQGWAISTTKTGPVDGVYTYAAKIEPVGVTLMFR